MSNQGGSSEQPERAHEAGQASDSPPAPIPSDSEIPGEKPPVLSPDVPMRGLPAWVTQRACRPTGRALIDPKLRRFSLRYLSQAVLATLAILAVLLFVDSLSNAALAAGLGSSVVILFLHPSSQAAKGRSVVGGHAMALAIGSVFSLLLFATPVESFLQNLPLIRNLALAVSVGLLMLVMAATDTEHPPAAGTVLGIATRSWEFQIALIIIVAVLLLAIIKLFLGEHLRDLT